MAPFTFPGTTTGFPLTGMLSEEWTSLLSRIASISKWNLSGLPEKMTIKISEIGLFTSEGYAALCAFVSHYAVLRFSFLHGTSCTRYYCQPNQPNSLCPNAYDQIIPLPKLTA